jgi:hypothetical protein
MFKTMMKKQLGNVALLHVYTSMPSLAWCWNSIKLESANYWSNLFYKFRYDSIQTTFPLFISRRFNISYFPCLTNKKRTKQTNKFLAKELFSETWSKATI